MKVGSEVGELITLDEYTIQMRYPKPKPMLLQELTTMREFFRPQHYLEPYHPVTGDPEVIKAFGCAIWFGSGAMDGVELDEDTPRDIPRGSPCDCYRRHGNRQPSRHRRGTWIKSSKSRRKIYGPST